MRPISTIVVVLVICLISGCKKDESDVPEGNLISNSTFEVNGIPGFDGWTGSSYSFIQDVPATDGIWALQLEPEWLPGEGYAETYITGYQGSYTFKFTCDAKSLNDWNGKVNLRLQNEKGTITTLKTIEFNYPSWSTMTTTIEVSLVKADKLIVHLSAGSTEVSMGKVLFDNVILEKV
jgi:hypothetical protein